MMIHDLDMACWLMGENPVALSASASSIVDKSIGEAGDVDTAIVTLEFASGALAVITNSRRASYGYDQRIEVHGEKGMLQAENVVESTLVKSTSEGVVSQKPMYFFLERYEGAYASELEAFIKLAAGEADAEVSGKDGERALALADAALRSLETGKKQIL
jgi:myo-inositol 2-dehydrogenase/D-chiro-inositol 1-dehydrogenase